MGGIYQELCEYLIQKYLVIMYFTVDGTKNFGRYLIQNLLFKKDPDELCSVGSLIIFRKTT